jgi:hypothetical protein
MTDVLRGRLTTLYAAMSPTLFRRGKYTLMMNALARQRNGPRG